MQVSFFPSANMVAGEQKSMQWQDLVAYLTAISPRMSKDGELYSLAEYASDNIKRANGNVIAIHGAVIDYDKKNRSPSDALRQLPGIACCWHSTYGNESFVRKWRLIIPFDRPVTPQEWPQAWNYIYEELLQKDEAIDISCKALSRAYYSPSCPPENKAIAFHGQQAGEFYSPVLQPVFTPVNTVQEYQPIPQDQLDNALSYINADDYHQWIEIGMAIKSELGEKGFAYFDRWSATSSKYTDSHQTRKKWDSFKSTGITVGTLYHHALQAGWLPAQDDKYVYQVSINLKTPDQQPQQEAPGLVGMVQKYILDSAFYPQPNLALASAICITATLMAHKVQGSTGLRTNLYCMGLAPSGSGKEHQRQTAIDLLESCHMQQHIIGVPASSTGLLYALHDAAGRGLLQIDEIGHFLKAAADTRASPYFKEVTSYMTQLFSSSTSTFYGKQYSQRSEKVQRVDIKQPCLSIFGTTVPGRFYEALTGEDIIDGFLSRWLLFDTDEYIIDGNFDRLLHIPEDLQHELNYWAGRVTNVDRAGNMDQAIKPAIIEKSPEANQLAISFMRQCREMIRDNTDGPAFCAVWSRAAEHAEKLALCGHTGGHISAEVMSWAIGVAESSSKRVMAAMADNFASNEYEAEGKRLIDWLKSERKWVTKSELVRGTRWMKRQRRNEILSDLIEACVIEMKEERAEGAGKPVQLFRKR